MAWGRWVLIKHNSRLRVKCSEGSRHGTAPQERLIQKEKQLLTSTRRTGQLRPGDTKKEQASGRGKARHGQRVNYGTKRSRLEGDMDDADDCPTSGPASSNQASQPSLRARTGGGGQGIAESQQQQ
ncbi:hypothetical protein BDV96DRAFT_656906 [Lophiotrema nucula]|uniref:Uncharacterized protein n=1 Tax=Lophiotrema nucula TaxID=690887 RepID=A0A6A5ZXQ2_9PLEO|nr:hypothetical protein BDV96DRAFT_656906 [Lophiotrema nucula]